MEAEIWCKTRRCDSHFQTSCLSKPRYVLVRLAEFGFSIKAPPDHTEMFVMNVSHGNCIKRDCRRGPLKRFNCWYCICLCVCVLGCVFEHGCVDKQPFSQEVLQLETSREENDGVAGGFASSFLGVWACPWSSAWLLVLLLNAYSRILSVWDFLMQLKRELRCGRISPWGLNTAGE